jgi:hypothetical protein
MIRELLRTVRQPEYTGENRCLPCTVVNVLIAAVVGVAVSKRSKPAGAGTVAGSLALIYLRGYLVPGTPELTKRYLPPTVLRWFGKEPAADLATGLGASPETTAEEDGATEQTDDEAATVPDDLEAYFLEAGILEPCEDRDDLCLTSAFEDDWLGAIESAVDSGIDTEDAVAAFGFDDDPGEFELEARGGGAYALQYGTDEIGEGPRYNAGMWPSYAALVADVAASRRLGSWLDEWAAYEPEAKGQLLGSLRMFLETCPTAEGGVEMTEETVTSCCSSETVVAVVCEETGDRLFEQPVPG